MLVQLLLKRDSMILGVFTAYIVLLLVTESYPCVDENGMCVVMGLVENFRPFSLPRTVNLALPGRFLPDRLHNVRPMVRLLMAPVLTLLSTCTLPSTTLLLAMALAPLRPR